MHSSTTNLNHKMISTIKRLKSLTAPRESAYLLLQAVMDEDVDIKIVINLIERDPVVSARILGIARSAFFTCSIIAQSIEDAVIRVLGLKMVKSLVTGIVLSSVVKSDQCISFNSDKYWAHAVLTAYFSQQLSSTGIQGISISAEQVYLCGLLHTLGIIALAEVSPDSMNEVFKHKEINPEYTLKELTKQFLGVDHHQAGYVLAKQWHLPKSVSTVMKHYHDFGPSEEFKKVVVIVGISSRWVNRYLLENEYLTQLEIAELTNNGLSEKDFYQCVDDWLGNCEELIKLSRFFVSTEVCDER